ncbi:putative amino acid permease [Acidisoma sp. 7E03]
MRVTSLKANAVSFFESLVMGIGGSAPGFSIAVTTATLFGTAGLVSPGALILFALPMLGIAVGYKALSLKRPDAGANYQWTTDAFGRFWGFLSGWALLVSGLVSMVSATLPFGTQTLNFVAPGLTDNVLLTSGIAVLWFLAIALILIIGVTLTSVMQVVMMVIELAVLTTILIAAVIHMALHGAALPFSWSWFGFGYAPGSFAASALLVVFFYWGWDVTSNLGEETKTDQPDAAGGGGFYSIFVTISYFTAFAVVALMLFGPQKGESFSDNLIYHMALTAGLGHAGALAASLAVILSSIGNLETTMLQSSRALYAMGRDRALPTSLSRIDAATQTPVRAMVVLIVSGVAIILGASFLPSIKVILSDSVDAVAIQVCFYYGLTGIVSFWAYRASWRRQPGTFCAYALFPAVSALLLFVLGLYAFTTFDMLTRIVGLGGLLIGLLLFRPKGYRPLVQAPAPAE